MVASVTIQPYKIVSVATGRAGPIFAILKWIERNEELDLLLGSLFVNWLKNTLNTHPGFPGIVLSNPRKHGHISLVSCSWEAGF